MTYPDTISADVMDTLYANGWEDLTDFYGNKVDLYKKKLTLLLMPERKILGE